MVRRRQADRRSDGIIALVLAEDHIQFSSTSAVEAKGMYKQRIRTAQGHAAHRGWVLLPLDHRRDFIGHGPRATCCAGGKTNDEEQQRHEGHHYHHPEKPQ